MAQANVGGEYEGARLGDKRRSDRLVKIAGTLAREPGLSFPAAMASEGQLEGFYRFLNNGNVTFDEIIRPHVKNTAARCREQKQMLIVHDTSPLQFEGERTGLGRLHTTAKGFFLHASLAVTMDRAPLGIIGAETLLRTGPRRRYPNRRKVRIDPNRESLRWWRGVKRAEDALGRSQHAIHVMDREGDNYDLYTQLLANSIRFVIRLAHDRNILGSETKLKSTALCGKCRFKREVHICSRVKALLYNQHIYPERTARDVTLDVSAMSVEIERSTNYIPGAPPSLKVNVVTAVERDCPRGCTPVCWHLVTTEPIASRKDIATIIDIYRNRWIVEEYFKALKSGCRIEQRQLESYRSLTNALGIFLPIAYRLLLLRDAARCAPDAQCTHLTKRQLFLLRKHSSRQMSSPTTNYEATFALAELGGHLRSNGPPGWMVLGRGFERLLAIEIGWLDRKKPKNVIDD